MHLIGTKQKIMDLIQIKWKVSRKHDTFRNSFTDIAKFLIHLLKALNIEFTFCNLE